MSKLNQQQTKAACGGLGGPDAPTLEDIVRCVHCGLCLNHCPTYNELRLETESPRGRLYLMRALSQGRIPITENVVRHLDLCLQCRNCQAVCPSGVRYGQIMEATRANILHDGRQAPASWLTSRLILRMFFSQPQRLRYPMAALGFYQRSGLQVVLHHSRLLDLLPTPLRNLNQLLPRLSARPFTVRGLVARPTDSPPQLRVALLAGCIMPYLFAQVHEATVRLLARHGCEVIVPPGQGCCGALHLHSGDRQEARRLARRNIDVFLAVNVDAIIVNVAGCGAAMKEYGELLKKDRRYAEKANRFSALVKDVHEFLADLPLRDGLGPLPRVVTYQDPCHLAHAQGIKAQPRALLRAIPGLELVEMSNADQCCGSAGLYNVIHPEMAQRLLRQKMHDVAATGAQIIATANAGCALQLEAGLRRYGLSARVAHVVELLDEAYRKGAQAP
ncbi:MAG: (Fe-S)-binding protein [Dehalococcoidia bacterium]